MTTTTTTTSTSTSPPEPVARVLVVGAGAIGGLLGVHLSHTGHDVTFLARGAHLEAMRNQGYLEVLSPTDGVRLRSSSSSRFIGALSECGSVYDVVILGLKMHQIVDVLTDLTSVLDPEGVILTTQNGIPWWYFQEYPYAERFPSFVNRTVESVDPGGKLKDGIDPKRLLASVVYPAAHIAAPGIIKHTEGIRFPVGEIGADIQTPRVQRISNMLIDAGFKSPVLTDVRAELWLKLWGTVAVNPLSALTHATLAQLCEDGSPGRSVAERVMEETERVANELGATMRVPMKRRLDGAGKVGDHKTSMLQDTESGRTLEVETVIGAVVELADVTGVKIPATRSLYDIVRMLASVMERERAKVCLLPTD